MRKLITLSISLFPILSGYAQQQPRKLDQPMEVKTCHIKVTANAFVAKTFVELEYYNPQNVEIEGVTYFSLNPGQLISAFQLELNGKHRDGSIEEKWKANNAYNSIVGKRVDPALLQVTHGDNYRLNIYPFAPKSSRKVTFTIVQLLTQKDDSLQYELPLTFTNTIADVSIDIEVTGNSELPQITGGFPEKSSFGKTGNNAFFKWHSFNVKYTKKLQFNIPMKENEYHFLNSNKPGRNEFALRLCSDVAKSFVPVQDKLAVFWDASASAHSRNIAKEISYLENYIYGKGIMNIDLYIFNSKVRQTAGFNLRRQKLSDIRKYLDNISYYGTTNLGLLDFSDLPANVVLIFSDGIQSSGIKTFKQGACLVNCISSSKYADLTRLNEISSGSGGKVIDLTSYSVKTAAESSGSAENMLFKVEGKNTAIYLNEALPLKSKNIFITGFTENKTDLQLKFGNNIHTSRLYDLVANITEDTILETFKIIQLIKNYEKVKRNPNWEEVLLFGLENKIVTERTAYIVLERIEDYINYKIAPPKELEEQCAQMNYVYSSKYRRKELKAHTQAEQVNHLIDGLKERVNWWNNANTAETKTVLSNAMTEQNSSAATETGKSSGNKTTSTTLSPSTVNNSTQNTIAEVVVTSAFGMKRTARSVTAAVHVINAEQLNTIRQQNINDALSGKIAGLQVQSQSAAKLGAGTMVRLRGENNLGVGQGALYVVDGTVISDSRDINVDDIEDISVLQGPAAAALFGSEGANGAIVISSKKARRNYGYYNYGPYKLSDMPDVEYMEVIKQTEKTDLWDEYLFMKTEHIEEISFYFDMADHFYSKKLKDQAFAIMEDGIEMCKGYPAGKRAAAYMYESWREFDKAVDIYKELLVENERNIGILKDLALCYFQNKQYQLALDTYYKGLLVDIGEDRYYDDYIRQGMLNEMNALIATQRRYLNLDEINPALILTLPAAIYITTGSNVGTIPDIKVTSPSMINYRIPGWYYYRSPNDRALKNKNDFSYNDNLTILYPEKGNYLLTSAVSYGSQVIPHYERVIIFRNFQMDNQEIEVQLVQMDNQYGEVEIGKFTW